MIGFTLDMRHVAHLIDGKGGQRVAAAVSKAIPKGLAIMERHHKKQETRRGGSNKPAVANMVTSRTGTWSKSFRIYHQKGALVGYYGSELARAPMLEQGGTIHAAGKLLTIPTDAARVGVGGALPARRYNLSFMMPGGKKALGVRKDPRHGGKDTVYFWLVEKVTIPARPGLQRTIKAKEAEVSGVILDAAFKGLDNRA